MRLYVMQLAINPASGSPVPGYLAQTDNGTNVLIDSGYAASDYRLPDQPEGRFDPDDYVLNRLAAIGVQPHEIAYVVCTHLDPDHSGSHNLFPTAEFVIQRAHYAAARRGDDPRFLPTESVWNDGRLRYRQVDGDTELLPGIELIESSGHVIGHQSVLVRLPNTGPVLLAIDAITRQLGDYTPETRPVGPYDSDEAGVRASTRKLVDLARREGVVLTIYGHDPEQWNSLRRSPDYYD